MFLKSIIFSDTSSFWYVPVIFIFMCCYGELLSDDGIVKILKYIRVIEPSSFYSETVGASSIIFINQNVDVEHFI